MTVSETLGSGRDRKTNFAAIETLARKVANTVFGQSCGPRCAGRTVLEIGTYKMGRVS